MRLPGRRVSIDILFRIVIAIVVDAELDLQILDAADDVLVLDRVAIISVCRRKANWRMPPDSAALRRRSKRLTIRSWVPGGRRDSEAGRQRAVLENYSADTVALDLDRPLVNTVVAELARRTISTSDLRQDWCLHSRGCIPCCPYSRPSR